MGGLKYINYTHFAQISYSRPFFDMQIALIVIFLEFPFLPVTEDPAIKEPDPPKKVFLPIFLNVLTCSPFPRFPSGRSTRPRCGLSILQRQEKLVILLLGHHHHHHNHIKPSSLSTPTTTSPSATTKQSSWSAFQRQGHVSKAMSMVMMVLQATIENTLEAKKWASSCFWNLIILIWSKGEKWS